MLFTPTTASAGVEKGQKIFKKKFRKYCRFSGVKFARNHTQDEWEAIYEAGKFKEAVKEICPKIQVKKVFANSPRGKVI